MNLSRHFTLEEMTHSQTASRRGVLNRPGPDEVENLRRLCLNILEPLRVHLGRPIMVSSAYRAPYVNRLVGGASTSQHVRGQAADIVVPGMSVDEVVKAIHDLNLPYDQLIDEFGDWVHVSYSARKRGDFLIARHVRGKTIYQRGGVT